MIRLAKYTVVLVVCLITLTVPPTVVVYAQSQVPDFSFNDFFGTYHLDRSSSGVAVLSVQEDMVVNFPIGSNLYGIRRSIPVSYQGHSVNLRIISVTDFAGNPINYRVYSNGQGDEVIQIGDPAIIITGQQTYRIKYQTSGVVILKPSSDEFLVDVNGRGWQETFASVKAFVYVAKGFATNQTAKPTCYVGYLSTEINACSVQDQNITTGRLVSAATTQLLSAHEGLVVRLDFKKGTFSQATQSHQWVIFIGAGLVVLALGCWLWRQKNRSHLVENNTSA